MNQMAELGSPIAPSPGDTAKRRQIVEGARRVFMAQGFDAASMDKIARAAGVSKGTLYVYFDNKEQLFLAIVREECQAQTEEIFDFDSNDHDVGAVLTRLGLGYVNFLVTEGRLPALRTVIAIADRMPEIGREFYDSGPSRAIAALASYLRVQVAAGVLAIEDCDVAAAQFMDSCLATIFRPALLNCSSQSSKEHIEHVVRTSVRVFLAAYLVRS
jgi:AcrR family transcriptional regulator